MKKQIVILGGGYAGVIAAARIAKRGIPVTLVDAREGLVERIRMHQVVAGDSFAPISYRRLLRNLPVEVIRARVTSIDREMKLVHTTNGDITYDRLVYALGSEDALNPLVLREQLRTAKRVMVVGGGLTGIETAAEIAERHPHIAVTLVDRGTIGHGLSARALRHLHAFFAMHNATLIENRFVSPDEKVDADVVVWCASFELSPIAWDAGLRCNERGQVVVDEHLRSSDPSIYVAGDAAFVPGLRMSCALAMPMGAYVADVLAGATNAPFRMGFVIQCISLGRNDGIIQFVNADDSPRDRALTGRPAAWIKEMVCRYTVLSLKLETRGLHYKWPQAEAA
jgi:NADH dehydrogenase FAD-containing subunit